MGHSKRLLLIPGKTSPFLIPDLFMFLGSTTTLPYTHLREPLRPHLSNFLAGDPRTLAARGAGHLPAACRRQELSPQASSSSSAVTPKTQAQGLGRGGWGLRVWNALAKQKEAQAATGLRGAGSCPHGWEARGGSCAGPPAAEGCGHRSGSRSFGPCGRPTLPHASDPDARRERAASPRRRLAKPGLEPGPLRARPCLPPPRTRAHTQSRCTFFLPSLASLPLPSLPSTPSSRNWEAARDWWQLSIAWSARKCICKQDIQEAAHPREWSAVHTP